MLAIKQKTSKQKMKNIALIGMMGSGKTSVGREIASLIGKEFVDTDEIFVSRYGNIARFFATHGETEFRKAEREISLEAVLESDRVVSLGGGAVLDSELMKKVKENCTVVLLTCEIAVLEKRIKIKADRPLITKKEDIENILKARNELYFGYADIVFDTSYRTPALSASEIVALL